MHDFGCDTIFSKTYVFEHFDQNSTLKRLKKHKDKKVSSMHRSGKWEEDFKTLFLEGLMTKKRELEITLERLKKSTQEYDGELHAGDFTDEVDDAQREISAHQIYSLLERKDKELGKIARLVERITGEQDFGLCEDCGERIPKERLLAVPEATLCVSCQREMERMDQTVNFSSAGFSSKRNMGWEGPEDPDDDLDDYDSEPYTGDYPLPGTHDPDFEESGS